VEARTVSESLERRLGDLIEDGRLTEHDADEIRDFQRFLGVATRETSTGKLLLLAEWMPYALGTGAAPSDA